MADFTGGPGFAAFVATFALVAGAILLFRSLSKHLRKVRTHPPEGEKPAGASASERPPATDAASDGAAPSTPSPASGA
ncbi:hypothetical protein [Demequina sp. NBRC 110053]|uniref:hypothetical protein n=1 Tax=Demequina sp. NBRC 110053 TaxID=1570342 RepID=UPI000A048628|nr:hypothetical protein [Demequina sp. NBRC 110053]